MPDDLRHIIGKTEIHRSLNTRNHHQAKAAFAVAYVDSERLFNDARQGLCIEHYKPEVLAKLSTPYQPARIDASIKLSEALARYVQSISMSGRSEYVSRRHAVDYSRAVNRYITDMGDMPIAAIQPSDIHKFASNLIQPSEPEVKGKPTEAGLGERSLA